MKLDDLLRFVLSIVIVLAFLYLTYVLFATPITLTGEIRDLAFTAFGVLSMIVKEITGYIWGSSAGSKDKQELIHKAVNNGE